VGGGWHKRALFTIGKALIGLYLGRAAVGSLYGAGGSIVVVIVWTYYSAQLFLFGAEFTWVYGQYQASPARPEKENSTARHPGPSAQIQH
jgi:membrane protein